MAGADNGMECTHCKAIRDEEEMNRDVKRKALTPVRSETCTYRTDSVARGVLAESPRYRHGTRVSPEGTA